jgi:hypothetical protein
MTIASMAVGPTTAGVIILSDDVLLRHLSIHVLFEA